MKKTQSVTGVLHLPDARLTFHVNFGDDQNIAIDLKGAESQMIGHILNQALRLSPDLQELLVTFADYLKAAAEKARHGEGDGGGQGPDEK